MSVQLQFFPTTTTITTSGYQQKLGKCKAGEGQQEHSGTAAKTPSKQNQQIIYSGQISTPFSSPISPSSTFAQSPKSVPSITVPAGGLKRIRPPEMDLPEMPNEDDDYSAAGSTASCINEPKAKQRRYEERMSSQLGGIYISPEKESAQEQIVGQEKHQSRPKIEEIADWDEEFLDDEDELIRQAPLVEEPQTTPTKMDELPGTTNWTKPSEGNQQESGEGSPKIVELNEEDADIDDEGFIENGDEKDWLGEPGKIVLSEQLRQLIRQDRAQSSTSTNGHHSPLLTRSQIRTGKELIPYIPSPLARQPSISTVPPIQEEKEANEEEVRNDEFLPDVGQIGDEQEGEEEMMEID